MAIKLIIAVTDQDWFESLQPRPDIAEVNFWAPSPTSFRALGPGELFLFKLHSPLNFIVGGGIFTYATKLPCSLAWEAFGEGNGARTLDEMRQRIAVYRHLDSADRSDFEIGCRILTQPFFFQKADWIPVPESWSPNIVSFKSYDTDDGDGLRAVKHRLHQDSFREAVITAYKGRCALSGLPETRLLDAAHIMADTDLEFGQPIVRNGLPLSKIHHAAFDAHLIGIDPDYRIHVADQLLSQNDGPMLEALKRLHGELIRSPAREQDQPDRDRLALRFEVFKAVA